MDFNDEFALALLDQDVTTGRESYKSTSQKDYAQLLKHWNVTSFSQTSVLEACPRKFFKIKEKAFLHGNPSEHFNVDFSFGHAVGAGVQHYLATGDLDMSIFQSIMAWKADWNAVIAKKRKSIHHAVFAVMAFAERFAGELLEEWEILVVDGKAAIELSFSFHCGNGFKHYAHLDIVLRNKRTGQLAVVDCKTTGSTPEEAMYANSSQALSYAIMLNTILPGQVHYEVMYLVWSSTDGTWTLMPFVKNALDQAEWIKDILLQQDMVKTYHTLQFFPKRGQSCYDFFRRCEFYGSCDRIDAPQLAELPEAEEAEQVDYVVDLREVIKQQKEVRN